MSKLTEIAKVLRLRRVRKSGLTNSFIPADGEPIYNNKDVPNSLYVGNGVTPLKSLTPIGYVGDYVKEIVINGEVEADKEVVIGSGWVANGFKQNVGYRYKIYQPSIEVIEYKPGWMAGDCDYNGVLNLDDADILKRIYFGQEDAHIALLEEKFGPQIVKQALDFSGDGKANAAEDYIMLKRYIFGTYNGNIKGDVLNNWEKTRRGEAWYLYQDVELKGPRINTDTVTLILNDSALAVNDAEFELVPKGNKTYLRCYTKCCPVRATRVAVIRNMQTYGSIKGLHIM